MNNVEIVIRFQTSSLEELGGDELNEWESIKANRIEKFLDEQLDSVENLYVKFNIK